MVHVSEDPSALTQIQRQRSAAHLLACAINQVDAKAQLIKGGSTEEGFFVDFQFSTPIDQSFLQSVSAAVISLVEEDLPIDTIEMVPESAQALLIQNGQTLRAQELGETQAVTVEMARIADFVDVCPWPLPLTTGELEAIQLLELKKIAGDSRGLVMRIEGVVFSRKKQVKRYLKHLKNIQKYDHRKIGLEQKLFYSSEYTGSNQWFWMPKGLALRESLKETWKQSLSSSGFSFVETPSFTRTAWLHQQRIDDEGLAEIDSSSVASPFHHLFHASLFALNRNKFSEMPVKYAECSTLFATDSEQHRRGLFGSMQVLADAATSFCQEGDVEGEVLNFLKMLKQFFASLKLDFKVEILSLPEKFHVGDLDRWVAVTKKFESALEQAELASSIRSAYLYSGPAIIVSVVDRWEREWEMSRIVVDFNIPERLGLRYELENNELQTPIMLVCNLFSSLERLIAVLIENHGGDWPLWIAPEQVRVITVSKDINDYALDLKRTLVNSGFRCELDLQSEALGVKIHQAEQAKVPFVVVVGQKEQQKELINVRTYKKYARQEQMSVEALATIMNNELSGACK
jgi:threonyl-tRNA synthetase